MSSETGTSLRVLERLCSEFWGGFRGSGVPSSPVWLVKSGQRVSQCESRKHGTFHAGRQAHERAGRTPNANLSPPGFFAHKVEHESRTQSGRSFQRTGTLAFERVYTANQNCVDAYPTFLVVLWGAGLLCSQVPAAFAGLMYLFVRQKYFVGYLGERTQSTPGYIFGKRIILFLFLMSLAGVANYYLILFFGSDFENYIKTVTTTISPLLLIP
ncbi:arachidonate 5-lipoxygenase-activating protein-like [Pteropus medius]|uniref:arachidonate 5-lipoxygenase-activating protein-like n=1 Tax=Pteropus vampyrus TaxID=132908 RepID=UPI00196AD752|nr:arachidonate 5-lipoxygenase-activating protein-like [Pteropus giganteus]